MIWFRTAKGEDRFPSVVAALAGLTWLLLGAGKAPTEWALASVVVGWILFGQMTIVLSHLARVGSHGKAKLLVRWGLWGRVTSLLGQASRWSQVLGVTGCAAAILPSTVMGGLWIGVCAGAIASNVWSCRALGLALRRLDD